MRAREEIHGKGRPGRDRPFGRSILYHEGSDPPERNIQDQHKRRQLVVTLQELQARHSPEKQARIRAFAEELLKTFEANHATYVNAAQGA